MRSHRLDSALSNLQRAAEQEPDHAYTTFLIAWCMYYLQNYQGALDTFDQLLHKGHNWATAQAYRALALSEVGRIQEAVDELRRAQRRGFRDKNPGYWEGRLEVWLAQLGSYVEAVEPLRYSIQLQPGESWTHYTLGWTYAELHRHDEAIRELQESVRMEPGSPDTHFALGWSFGETGQFDKAADAYVRALQLRSDDALAHFNLGVAYRELGRVEEEIEEYKKALEIAPDHRGALINLAMAYSRSGHGESAVEKWNQVINCKPDSIDGYGSLSLAYGHLGRYQKLLTSHERLNGLVRARGQ